MTGFAEGLNLRCERKRGVHADPKAVDLNTEKVGLNK